MRNCKKSLRFPGMQGRSYHTAITTVVVIVVSILPIYARAQSTDNKNRPDTAAINHQIRAAQDLANPDSAILLYKKLVQQSTDIGYPDGVFNALMQMSILYREKDDYKTTEATLQQALGWANKAKRKDALAWCYNNMGDLYESQGDYAKGADYFYKALDAIRKVPGPNITAANINLNLGYLYKLLGQLPKAIAFYNETERICIAGHFEYQLAGVYIDKGAFYIDTHQPDSARLCFARVLDIAKKLKQTDLLAMANNGVGSSLMAGGKYKEAIPYLQTAIDSAKKNYHEIALDASYMLGDALLHVRRYKEAESILISALNETKAVNSRYNYIEGYSKLIEVYKATGQYQKAMDCMDSVAALKDAMMSAENTKAISQMELKYKTAEKDKELAQSQLLITKQKSKIARKNTLIASVVSGIILLSLIFWLSYRNIRSKQRLQTEQITSLQRENTISILKGVVQGEENERARLARELHDGIGGMLSAAMMRLMTMRHANEAVVKIPAYHEAMTTLDEIGDEIRKTAHNLMPAALLRQSLPDAVLSYCNSVQEGSGLQVDFQYYGDFDAFSQEFKLNVYRIIQELLKNIVAHAYATHAFVQLIVNGNVLAITVEDDGRGFNKNETTSGIGLHNLQARVSGLQGSYTIESEPGKGTSVYIEFDLAMLPKTTIYENQDSNS